MFKYFFFFGGRLTLALPIDVQFQVEIRNRPLAGWLTTPLTVREVWDSIPGSVTSISVTNGSPMLRRVFASKYNEIFLIVFSGRKEILLVLFLRLGPGIRACEYGTRPQDSASSL